MFNDEFVFRSGNSHYSRNRVVELVPDQKLSWIVVESIRTTDNFAWTGTKMTESKYYPANRLLELTVGKSVFPKLDFFRYFNMICNCPINY